MGFSAVGGEGGDEVEALVCSWSNVEVTLEGGDIHLGVFHCVGGFPGVERRHGECYAIWMPYQIDVTRLGRELLI